MVYGQLDNANQIINTAVWEQEPEDFFKPCVLIPDDIPAGIGNYWDGEHFRRGAIDGEIIVPLPPPPEPVEPYDEFADATNALLELGVKKVVT